MQKRLLRYLFRLEYILAAGLTMVFVWGLLVISDNLPDVDETSFLEPILDRIDFLNIADVSLDAVFAVRDAEFPDPRIKVINIGEVAPAPDGKIAMLLYKLHNCGARVIGIDVFLDEQHVERFPEERLPEFEALVEAIHDIPDVVVVNGFDKATMEAEIVLHPLVLEAEPAQGFANLWPDPDGVIRRFLPKAMVGGEEWYSLPIRMMQLYDENTVREILRQPAEPQIIYYTGTYYQYDSVPIDDVVYGSMYDHGYFQDAVVLVGFVNEGGLFYLHDTHKTPMGKKIDVEGPDMPGVLIHANVLNMLLRNRFIVPVPEWVDWVLLFVLSYVSLALYRVLRTKARNRYWVVVLITTVVLSEALIVFFLPLIAFFYLNIKISYNLMATGVFMFIPAGAAITKLFFYIERLRFVKYAEKGSRGVTPVLLEAFKHDEPFIANTRLLHACLYSIQLVWVIRAMQRMQSDAAVTQILHPRLQQWQENIPAVEAVFHRQDAASRSLRHFYRFLEGKKEEFLYESRIKQMFFTTELPTFNPFLAFEDWEQILPYARELLLRQLPLDLSTTIYAVNATRVIHMQGAKIAPDGVERLRELPEGVYCTMQSDTKEWIRISPFCEWAECKVHYRHELFVFSALIHRQAAIEKIPVFYGLGPACEPVLTVRAIHELFGFGHNKKL